MPDSEGVTEILGISVNRLFNIWIFVNKYYSFLVFHQNFIFSLIIRKLKVRR